MNINIVATRLKAISAKTRINDDKPKTRLQPDNNQLHKE